jgi:type I restriction enzyme S subunit
MKYLPIVVPPSEDQNAAARFIRAADQRTKRIVRAKRKLIELLNEQKQAIIHRAVTRGVDTAVRLKASGIPWLRDIPEGWDSLRSKYLFREVDERSKTGEETHLSMSQRLGLVPSAQLEEKRLIPESYVGAKVCERGDLVLNRLKAHLGVFALAPQPGLVSPDYTVFRRVREMQTEYFEFLYRTPACRVELRKRAKGIVQGFWRLYTDDFYDIRVPVPPCAEQAAIVRRIEMDMMRPNVGIARVQREIDLVREYLTRLVADVVTGQVDVRDVAARLPNMEPEAVIGIGPQDDESEELLEAVVDHE